MDLLYLRLHLRGIFHYDFQHRLNMPPFPVHLGILGKAIPVFVERSIDEEGQLLGNQWLLTRMNGFGWGRFCYISFNKNKQTFLSLSDLGACVGLCLSGVLRFPVPERRLVQ